MMNCQELKANLDDYLDGYAAPGTGEAVERHVSGCGACAAAVDAERRLRRQLRRLGQSDVPVPEPLFYANALATAAERHEPSVRRRAWLAGFGSAMVAAVGLVAVALVLLGSPDDAAAPQGIQSVRMSLDTERTVNLVFAASETLQDARLTVVLPAGIELAGLEGRRRVSWLTSLSPGRNVLPLKLIATAPAGGELLATLEHEDDDRTFRVRLDVDDGAV